MTPQGLPYDQAVSSGRLLPDFDKPTDWFAEGLIIAPALPAVATVVGECEIRPHKMVWSERHEPMQMQGSGPGIYSTLIPEPAHLRFSSSHRITTRVSAATFEGARNIALQRFARVASLTSLVMSQVGFPPEAAIRFAAMAPADDPLNRVGDLVEARGHAMPIAPMDPQLVGLVTSAYRSATSDPRLGRLIDTWYEADYRAGLAFTVEDRQDVVIRFTTILEGVGNAMRPGKALSAEARDQRESAIEQLASVLNGHPRLDDAVQAVRDTHSIIRRTGLESEWARIESAGVALGVPAGNIQLASRAYRQRSAEGLAHFGYGDVQPSDVDSARSAARSYLTAYLRNTS